MPGIEKKIDDLEKEVSQLKIMVMQQNASKKNISLKGFLKGVKISEDSIKKSKKSLFKSGG